MNKSIITDIIEMKEILIELTNQLIELRKKQDKICFAVENMRFVARYHQPCTTCKGLFNE
ncbi:MAG: hypothetical protein R3321_05105 [Nitrososphaeraceae archaeon]|nr:hypothetical protein [Nitrososphaeraceae archaeon]